MQSYSAPIRRRPATTIMATTAMSCRWPDRSFFSPLLRPHSSSCAVAAASSSSADALFLCNIHVQAVYYGPLWDGPPQAAAVKRLLAAFGRQHCGRLLLYGRTGPYPLRRPRAKVIPISVMCFSREARANWRLANAGLRVSGGENTKVHLSSVVEGRPGVGAIWGSL